ncbi:hypothetical protein T4D_3315 [Trichinella pseudospiralis]|uniref:Uncharacterized protein n=1 Tax=Trichinella pseudospiralis TaxID=6337 RepID=A0A0V1FXZ9_TRIPS|nr:hypothetical protein T4D_3315 [Trichinella pseudospiralis]
MNCKSSLVMQAILLAAIKLLNYALRIVTILGNNISATLRVYNLKQLSINLILRYLAESEHDHNQIA